MSRRELLRHVGLGMSLTAAWSLERQEAAVAGSLAQRPATGTRQLPAGAVIRTSLKDVDPLSVSGVTLFHEHLGDGRPDAGGGPPSTPGQDPRWMAEELAATAVAGVRCIVAAQAGVPGPAMLSYLNTISARSGVAIVPAGGLLMLERYSPEIRAAAEDRIADILVEAAAVGRFGALGEIGLDNDAGDLAPDEKKVFRAVAKAHLRTGLPMFTHCNYSTGPHVAVDIALRQLDVLEAAGVAPQSCAIGHLCCVSDVNARISKRIAERGAFVGFDRLSRQEQWVTDEQRAKAIVALIEAGYAAQILFSSDFGGTINLATGERNSYTGPLHARDGGPGYARSLRLSLPKLRQAGVDEESIRRITIDNPRRFLAFVPKKA